MSTTSTEHRRAWDRFQRVYFVHAAAMESFRLLQVVPGAVDQLTASIQTRHGFRAGPEAGQIRATVDGLLEEVSGEVETGFQAIRSSALVAICAAFEYLVKARFVDAATADVEAATAIVAARKPAIKLDVSEVLGLAAHEQWLAIADELFKRVGEGGRPMSERVKHLLLECVALHPVEAKQREAELVDLFQSSEGESLAKQFNLAFLIRNCFVHNGGRVNRTLHRAAGWPMGREVILGDPETRGLIAAVRKVAEAASPYWLLSLG